MEELIGRDNEVRELRRCYGSQRSEFVVLYGRRRIGKTFLVNRVFGGKFAFYFTGSHNVPRERQLENFSRALQQYGRVSYPFSIDNWYHAFDMLQEVLKSRRTQGKKVVFFDEMPWIDNQKSSFVMALENFWNTWAALRDDICLIACGSATSWMVDNLLKNQGGLYNRVTSQIYLRPFSLCECEQYLRRHRCVWDRYAITQYYMYLGGVPFYLSLLDYGKSLEKNMDALFFETNARLANEFADLYNVLFEGADSYISVVRLLAERRQGLTRQEISERLSNGGWLTKVLDNLEKCDFIVGYHRFGSRKKGTIYRLTDFFTLFYLRFVEGVRRGQSDYWQRRSKRPDVRSWQGYSFELVGLMHIAQIRQRLGIAGMMTEECSWRSKEEQEIDESGRKMKAQVDLVIDRSDRLIHLCEMKFSENSYVITKEYEERLRDKMAVFRMETKTRKGLLTTMITTYGVKPTVNSGIVQAEVQMDDLFAPVIS